MTTASELLYREARLLDDHRYKEWLDLFTPDAIYWIPLDEHADPRRAPSILFDDAERRAQRVDRLLHDRAYAQLPESHTVHAITNVEVLEDSDGSGDRPVRCALVVHEVRGSDPMQHGLGEVRALAARCDYRLREVDGTWMIAAKTVLLISRHLPHANLTFIL